MINTIVASSNLVAIGALYQYEYFSKPWWIILSAMIASFLMHISETKHNLPGVWLVQYSNQLLWIDRLTAVSTGLYILPYLTKSTFITGVIGLTCNVISEHVSGYLFVLFHVIWHILAFGIMGVVWK